MAGCDDIMVNSKEPALFNSKVTFGLITNIFFSGSCKVVVEFKNTLYMLNHLPLKWLYVTINCDCGNSPICRKCVNCTTSIPIVLGVGI